jgi:4-aminobutyrate aminotransferase-like enzyme/Ser/Thr protein kinase RdoA (MazF antagonist)
MLALRASAPSIGAAEGERIARDAYGLAVSISPLSGERERNFLLRTADQREFVLKIFDPLAGPASADCLARVLDFLAEIDPGLPVPRLIPTLRGEGIGVHNRDGEHYPTCLMSFIPGRLLVESPLNPSLLRQIGKTLARLDTALQGFFHESLGRPMAWDVRRLPELVEFSEYIESPATRAAVAKVSGSWRERLPELRRLRGQAIHGDCHGRNLLLGADANSIGGILDFGDMIHAPLILDVGIALAELLTESSVPVASLAEVLRGFAAGQELQSGAVDLLFDVVTARHAAAILLHAWRRRNDAAGAALLQDSALAAGASLAQLLAMDRAALVASWQAAAGIGATLQRRSIVAGSGGLLDRRHRLMGAGAELFYAQPLHIVRGSGVWLYDAAGRPYLDVYNNVAHVGHAHSGVAQAIARQTALLATHTRYLHETILDYAEQLTDRLPAHLDACIFVNSGSEANDVAWRIAKLATGRRGALVMQHAYHGITDAVGSLTPGAGQPSDPWVAALTPPPAEAGVHQSLETLAKRGFEAAAFFIDSALTSSGIFDPPPGWAKDVEAQLRAAGCLVVADEVQYGLGRSGSHFWGFERRGLSPDIVTLGKPVGNGFPMGVVIANHAMIEAFQAKCGFFSTFGGNAVAAAAGLAVLEALDREDLMANAQDTGQYLREQLVQVAARHACLGEVRGSGLLLGLSVQGADFAAAKLNTQKIVNDLVTQFSILIGAEGPNGSVLKLRPPLPFRREHADTVAQAIDAIAARLS